MTQRQLTLLIALAEKAIDSHLYPAVTSDLIVKLLREVVNEYESQAKE